jgi:hypothetical protein
MKTEPCKCEVCAWLDTPPEKRRLTERQMLRKVDNRSLMARIERSRTER